MVYVSKTYGDMKPYLKGVHLILESWRPYRDEYGWRLRGEELNMDEVEGTWEGIEEAEKHKLVMKVL